MNWLINSAKNLGGYFQKNSSIIFTICATGGVITTSVLACRATIKACEILKNREEEIFQENEDIAEPEDVHIDPKETIRLIWKLYLPTMGMGLTTIACIIGINKSYMKKTAALGALYSITETAFKEYKDKVVETIGEKKEETIRDDIAKEHIAKLPKSTQIIFTGKGDTLCYDTLSGRMFKSDIESIKKLENDINKELRFNDFITLNDLYDKMGLDPTKLGYELGWNIDHGGLEFNYSSQLTPDGIPCLVIDYDLTPKAEYLW